MGKLDKAISLLEEILNDRGVPRNIKNSIEEAIQEMKAEEESENVKISTLVSVLDEASNDPNISLYARTKIWDVVSKLEDLNR
ncbi:MAG: hypothetical protein GTN39_05365 [Candidatus Aenigmarchaeota archaeon]|nr:hypothetical protein [Candidatus Aenigmarchaeota archaeon]